MGPRWRHHGRIQEASRQNSANKPVPVRLKKQGHRPSRHESLSRPEQRPAVRPVGRLLVRHRQTKIVHCSPERNPRLESQRLTQNFRKLRNFSPAVGLSRCESRTRAVQGPRRLS
jgi:hypothetical protein